jgi:tRNA (cmo5U34)-methyltransferase
MSHDQIYDKPQDPVKAFKFDRKVVNVFPDMIKRSVPGYELIINQISILTNYYAKSGCNYYDLGASLGAATLAMRENIQYPDCHIYAIDNSPDMINECRNNISPHDATVQVDFICADIRDIKIQKAQMVVLNFTLQFIQPGQRNDLLKGIYNGLNDGGILILSEKIAFENKEEQNLQTDLHYEFKRANGYSELEISQKRTALENVLIPETVKQNKERLRSAGFSESFLWFQCYNFASILAIK